ncbi:PREDICTED: disease resistance protein RPM1-like [Tarenaya hassleriana]|uniref:disease resistance protein RPM1-like n=1 Tax=Tarenaya hassleriana TaxID=28532 RepID=UPI00053C6B6C|nr:PREDICTED: disease resistance protein RPM1-like [Tarenaya hassleriana]
MASGLIDLGVGRILNVLESEVLQQTGLRDEIEMTKLKLRFMRSFLEQHASASGSRDAVFTTFVKETRDLAYHIENIVDGFSYHINRRAGQAWLKRASHFPAYLRKRRSLVSELETVNQKIQQLSALMDMFHSEGAASLPSTGGDGQWAKNLQESSFFAGDDSLVGIDDSVDEVTWWLLDSEPQRIVVTVVGMGGSGKTTLASSIFRSHCVRRHFDSCCCWVTVSQSYDINNVIKAMLKEICKELGLQAPTDLSSMEYMQLMEILVNILRHKRYFIVFDDVWSTEFLDLICERLPNDVNGSRLMITTRSERVADFSFGTVSRSHRMEPLSEDKAWELFCKNAFSRNPMQNQGSNIESIARNLVQKCRGLPLAIATLGSMMSTRRSESEWRRIHDNLTWELSNNPELGHIQRILVLSFNDLPNPQKHCFLYCSIFPEDYEIERKRLVRMWMAHGFVEQSNGPKPEEVAESYIMELICRNLLQVVSWNISGRPKVIKMHDVVREVALVISKREKFCDVYMDEMEEAQCDETRHLCVQRGISSGVIPRNLYTLLVCPISQEKFGLLDGVKLLRALDLEDSGIDNLSDSLVKLYNLKYLNLRKTKVRKLPKSFHRLINLETLLIKHSEIEELPAGISKLRKLRFLVVNRNTLMTDSSNIWQLKRLEVLDGVLPKTNLVKNLGKMTKLTKLTLWDVRKDHMDDLRDSLSKLKDLRSLSLSPISEADTLPIDEISPPANIEKLNLYGRLERVPTWFRTLRKLTTLALSWSELREDPIPYIQALPNLVKVIFFGNVYEGDRLHFEEGFPSLKVLWITNMAHLREIVIQKGAMPHLQTLQIVACEGIKRLPDGIESLSSLQELSLYGVSDELTEESIDRSKFNHIPTITIA